MDPWREESYKKAAKKFDTVGPLGVTADNHKVIGSTPPEELKANPGKTLSDLMTGEEILRYLRGEKEIIEKYSAKNYREDPAVQDFLGNRKRTLNLSIEFLRSKKRLPEEFNEFKPR